MQRKASIEEVRITLVCPYCGERITLTTSKPYGVYTATCRCGASLRVRVDIRASADRVTEDMIKSFEEWLVREKKLLKDTARRYARYVLDYIRENRRPPSTSPLDYFEEYRLLLSEDKPQHHPGSDGDASDEVHVG